MTSKATYGGLTPKTMEILQAKEGFSELNCE
jgi:hypothetical protein